VFPCTTMSRAGNDSSSSEQPIMNKPLKGRTSDDVSLGEPLIVFTQFAYFVHSLRWRG
jgi:hypothetical protein